ncbi:MAG: HlyD family efflux transporter periplasmic adaptor subunit [Sulfuricellaceae bacterium]|nr:HlyD family efflux transporter periplasmic adaptor subunit [Sulfuricellaceae bacterium]
MEKLGWVFRVLALLPLAACGQQPSGVLQGYAEGEYVRVAAPIAGNLAELKVARGGQAQAGDALYVLEQENERAARLEAEERAKAAAEQVDALQAQRRQAMSALALAEVSYRRTAQLTAQHFLAKQKLDEARTALEQSRAGLSGTEAQLASAQAGWQAAQAVLKQADWKLGQKSVAAPVAGLVQDTLYTQGEWVPAGSPVVVLLPPQNIMVRFYVPQGLIGRLKTGQAVSLSCDGCGAPIAARIDYLAPQAEYTPPVIYSKENRDKLMFLAEARPASADAVKLHPGQPVDVALIP